MKTQKKPNKTEIIPVIKTNHFALVTWLLPVATILSDEKKGNCRDKMKRRWTLVERQQVGCDSANRDNRYKLSGQHSDHHPAIESFLKMFEVSLHFCT